MSMMERSKVRRRFSAVQSLFRGAVQLLVLIVLGLSGTALRAQTIEIRLVNGRSGRPMADTCIYVAVGDRSNPKSGTPLSTQTDANGIVELRLIDENTKTDTQGQQLVCGLPGVINPTVKYGDTIYIRAGYVLCQSRAADYSWLAMTDFSTKQIIQQGIVAANACGKATTSPKPGQVVIFVRPLTWWEKMKQ